MSAPGIEIPFTASHHQRPFKLLELPPDLLALLESSSPPALTISAAPNAQALLGTGTQTFQMRQKNTSNPLMILQPGVEGSVSAVARVEDTIELVPWEEAPVKASKWHEKFAKGRK